ncbi:MAG: aldo/keto reductase [Desulfobacteraceae bacterium]|jgi:predicted aldo/keto reductase-like oxidoreductase
MPQKKREYSRRDFMKTAGTAGLGSALFSLGDSSPCRAGPSSEQPEHAKVPKRPFGKTGIDVPVLALGGVLKMSDLLVFRQAVRMGVTYWDTADSYKWGNNEQAIGKYFTKFSEDRKKVFLVTKSATSDPQKLTEKLGASLEKMNTSYIDLYLIHYVNDAEKELTADVKAWAEKAKSNGKIRLFGFSSHKNMEKNMVTAANLGWIDGIMMSYNYRLMHKAEMKKAVAACVTAGIGLTAMKTQAAFSANFYSTIGSETDDAIKMTEKFLEKGYTTEQARLKAVWENPDIASICSAMPNMTILKANVAAALNKQPLSQGDRQRLAVYAKRTAGGYCAGCAGICESAVDAQIPISDIMRYCMYNHSYGDRKTAAYLFRKLPADVRHNLVRADYTKAENNCPQKIQIGEVLKKAHENLA